VVETNTNATNPLRVQSLVSVATGTVWGSAIRV